MKAPVSTFRKKSWTEMVSVTGLCIGMGLGFCFGLGIGMSGAQGATVLYYQMEGTAGTTAAAVADSGANGLTGTAGNYGGGGAATPTYSGVTVGPIITAGIGGAVVNANNTTSLKFENPGVAGGNFQTNAGGRVTLASSALLEPANFTIEAFVRVESQIQFASIVGKERNSGSTWLMDSNPSGHSGVTEPTNMTLRARIDHQVLESSGGMGSGQNQSFGSSGSISSAATGLGDGWHHVAMTYDDSENRVRLFVDYVQVGTGVLSADGVQDLVYNGGLFFIGGGGGGRGFDGWIDEVRFSDSLLVTNDFLRVVPEPGRMVLLMMAGLMGMMWRRRG